MDAYNGFSGKERAANGAALRRALDSGKVPPPEGPCSVCRDPQAKLEYHSEDYSKPYSWTPPAAYPVCLGCHRTHLHKRFANPVRWEAFKAHVRRGGYAADLRDPAVEREMRHLVVALRSGGAPELRSLRPYPMSVGSEWWAQLSAVAIDQATVLAGAEPTAQA